MALTRARPVAGDEALCAEIDSEVAEILAMPHDAKVVAAEAVKMRHLIEEEKPPRDMWDLKLVPGGLIDLEFIAQVAVLCGWVEGGRHSTATAEVLAGLTPDHAGADTRDVLSEAHRFYSTLTQTIRLCLMGELDPDDIPPGLEELLLRSTDMPDMSVLAAQVKSTAAQVRTHFDQLLGSESRSRQRRPGTKASR